MKKSNKLLLGAFLTVLLIFAGIHIALYAKYKNGNYALYHRAQINTNDEFVPFREVKLIRIRNVYSANVRFGEVAGVERGKEGEIQYEQKGDSLIISGQYLKSGQENNRVHINITLPFDGTIITDSVSNVSLQPNQFLKTKITTVPNNP
jgi:hypothetical protein